jgi:O-antigen ligase
MDPTQLLALAVCLAAGVWAVVLAGRLATMPASLIVIVAVSCFGANFGTWDIGPVAASIDRLAIVALVGIGVLKRILTPQPAIKLDRSDVAIAAMIGFLLVSVMTHPRPPTKLESSPTPWYLFTTSFLIPALVYWAVRFRRSGPHDVMLLCGFFALLGAYLAFTAIFEIHGPRALVFPRHILAARLMYWGRAVGPFRSAPVLGTWLTVATVAAILYASQRRGAARTAALGLVPLLAYAQYLTKTRSAWVGFVIAVPMAFILSGTRTTRQIVALAAIGILLLGGLFFGEQFINPSRVEGAATVAHSSSQRLALLQRAAALVVQKPLWGWGFRQFEYASRTYGGGGPLRVVEASAGEGLASHNLLLRVVAETGIVGTTIFVSIFVLWVGRCRRELRSTEPGSPRRTLVILFLGGLVGYWSEALFHDVTFQMQENFLLFFLAACLCTVEQPVARREPVAVAAPDLFRVQPALSPAYSAH